MAPSPSPVAPRILITDDLADDCVQILKDHRFDVAYSPGLKGDKLKAEIASRDGLIVRSGTKVTKEVIEAGIKLTAIGRAGIGVDNVDLAAATRRGIVVMNTPLGNVASAAEHTFGLLLALARNIPRGDAGLRQGVWKRHELVGVEMEGKTLGIVGLGKIGAEVSQFARSFHMKVVAFDPYLSKERAAEMEIELLDFDALLAASDVITIHTPLNDKTRGLFGARAFGLMKKTARLINCARGGIVDEAALGAALRERRIAGAAIDVFEKEPLDPKSPLLGIENVVLTPHLGASTEEALLKVSTDIAQQFVEFYTNGKTTHAVNVAAVGDPALRPYVGLAELLGKLAVQLGGQRLTAVEVAVNGAIAGYDMKCVTVAALNGVLKPICGEGINFVNAGLVAQERGIAVVERRTKETRGYANLVTVKVEADAGPCVVAGTLLEGRDARVVRIDDYDVDLHLNGHLLVMRYPDRPGMVGRFGTILGRNNINIAAMDVARRERGGEALVVLTLDDPVSDAVKAELGKALEVPANRIWAVRL